MQNGRTCTLNYNTATYGTPTWVALGRVSSPSQSQSRPTSRKTYRSATTSKFATGLMDTEISFDYVQKDDAATGTDSVLAALYASYYSDTAMDVCSLDGSASTTGSHGIRLPCVVSSIEKSADDEDAVTYSVTLVEIESDDQEAASYTIP